MVSKIRAFLGRLDLGRRGLRALVWARKTVPSRAPARGALDPVVDQFLSARMKERLGGGPGGTGEQPPSAWDAPNPDMEAVRREALAADTEIFALQNTPMPAVDIAEETVAVPGFPDVRVRLYRPLGATGGAGGDAGNSGGARLPVLVQFYGGAFRQGGYDYPNFDYVYRSRAAEAGIVVAAVDYARAPEHRFPTPVRQGVAVLRWLFAEADRLGVDPCRVAVGGQSAGGNIAASVVNTLAASDAGPRVRMQVLEVPLLDLSDRHKDFGAVSALGVPAGLLRAERKKVASMYMGSLSSRALADPEASPLRNTNLWNVPETYLFMAANDALRGDGQAYLERLRAAGVPAAGFLALGQTHESMSFTGWTAAARGWQAAVIGILRTLHNDPQPYSAPPQE